jgi:dienelactone hydrolase
MMSTQQLSSCCISGHIHEGTPQGSISTIGGLRTYIALPEGGDKKKTVIFLPDVLGTDYPNAQLLADEWAKNGFYVYIPDVFE